MAGLRSVVSVGDVLAAALAWPHRVREGLTQTAALVWNAAEYFCMQQLTVVASHVQ